jgi:hypothetical protein
MHEQMLKFHNLDSPTKIMESQWWDNMTNYTSWPLVLSTTSEKVGFKLMVLNFNNISLISWRSVLLVEDTGVPRKKHRPVASYWQT